MALANAGFILASHGKHVLLIDGDFAKPSIHKYVRPLMDDEVFASTDGLIDLLWEYTVLARKEDTIDLPRIREKFSLLRLEGYGISVDVPVDHFGLIRLLPSHGRTRSSVARTEYMDWVHFDELLEGPAFFDHCLYAWAQMYDYILIDIASGSLNSSNRFVFRAVDILAICFTYDEESIDSAAKIAKIPSFLQENPHVVVPVPMRVDPAEKLYLDRARKRAQIAFSSDERTSPNHVNLHNIIENEIMEIPYYRYTRKLAYIEDRPEMSTSLLSMYGNLVTCLTVGKVSGLVPISNTARDLLRNSFARPHIDDQIRFERPKPYQGRGKYCFVSYTRDDRDRVMPLVEEIAEIGFPVWWDEAIPGGEEWWAYLEERIRNAANVLLFLTRQATSSKYVRREVHYAIKSGKPIVPIDLEGVRYSLEKWPDIARYQALNIYSDTIRQQLCDALRNAGLEVSLKDSL